MKKEEVKAKGKEKTERVVSLDIFRGLTIWFMILVNFGSGYSILEHSAWDGVTIADFVMPYFLFIVGCSIAFAMGPHVEPLHIDEEKFDKHPMQLKLSVFFKVLKRSLRLFFLGLIMQGGNSVPDYDLSKLRIMGVLQRIAIDYFLVATIVTFVPCVDIKSLHHWIAGKFNSSANDVKIINDGTLYNVHEDDVNTGMNQINGISDTDSSNKKSDVDNGVNHKYYDRDHVERSSGTMSDYMIRLLIGNQGIFCIAMKYIYYWIIAILILIIHVIISFWYPLPQECGSQRFGPACNAAGEIDVALLTPSHMYNDPTCKYAEPPCKYFDPEGIFSTIASSLSTFIGLYFGYVLLNFSSRSQKLPSEKNHSNMLILIHWIAPATMLTLIGVILHFGGVPFNKNLYSYSYIAFMGGTAGFLLSLCYIIADMLPQWFESRDKKKQSAIRRETDDSLITAESSEHSKISLKNIRLGDRTSDEKSFVRQIVHIVSLPVLVLGMNSIAIYVGSDIGADAFGSTGGGGWFYWKTKENGLIPFLFRYIFLGMLNLSHDAARLAFGLTYVTLWVIVAAILYKKRIFLKV